MQQFLEDLDKAKTDFEKRKGKRMTIKMTGFSDEWKVTVEFKKQKFG